MPENKRLLKSVSVLYIDKYTTIPNYIKNTMKLFFKKTFYCDNLNEADDIYFLKKPKLIISEITLDNVSCLPLLFSFRKYNEDLQIILTSNNLTIEILKSIVRLHVVDILEKPLEPSIFINNINLVAKRIKPNNSRLDFVHLNENYKYNYINQYILKNNKSINLTINEIKFIELLIKKKGKPISIDIIELNIWGDMVVGNSRFKSLLKRLRDKIGNELVCNVQGVGYYIK